MKQFIKDYFTFNKGERNGILVLMGILIIVIAIPYFIPLFIKDDSVDFTAFKQEIKKFEQGLKENTETNPDSSRVKEFDYNDVNKSSAEAILHPFVFNPNDLPEEKWKELGFDDKQIRIIKNYEAKGGKFYKKEDLKKIYGISESEYNVLEPYINIPEDKKNYEKKTKATYPKSEKNTVIIELNSADTNDLKKLKGIGSWYAKKIITYRSRLGGFYKKEQLMEVKGIDSTRYAGFSDFISINKFLLTTININTATFEELKAHPYIGYNLALSLINLRQKHGNFSTVADIKKSVLVTDEIFEKISSYLSVK